jgi:hypothetical protein
VTAELAAGRLEDVVRAAREVVASTPRRRGSASKSGAENEEVRRSFRALGLAFALAVLLVYMILAAEFESLVHPLTVLLSVPLALVGAAVALRVTGAGLNAVSLIGLVVLVGIVDNDAVVKVDFINRMRRDGMPVRKAILAAGRARFRPIVINTVTALLGLLPMALGIGPGAAFQAPLAIAVFGGLLSATALTLIVIPVAYSLTEDARQWLQLRARAVRSLVAHATAAEWWKHLRRVRHPRLPTCARRTVDRACRRAAGGRDDGVRGARARRPRLGLQFTNSDHARGGFAAAHRGRRAPRRDGGAHRGARHVAHRGARLQRVKGVRGVRPCPSRARATAWPRSKSTSRHARGWASLGLELSEALAALRPELPEALRGPYVQTVRAARGAAASRDFLRFSVAGPHSRPCAGAS